MTERLKNTNDPNGILWLVLTPDAQQRLRGEHPPVHAEEYYHHMTLAFDVPRSSVEEFIGRSAIVYAYAHAHDADVQAARIRTNPEHGLPDTYGVPHVTLSTAEGIEPFASVAMLKGDHTETSIDPHHEIEGTIEFLPFEK